MNTPSLSDEVILVTGASGFLGERLVGHLAGLGARVYGTWHTRPIGFPNAESICVDLANPEQTSRTIGEVSPTAIAHCAAMTDASACEKDPAAARRSIVGSTQNLISLLGETGTAHPARLVFVSTDLVFDGESAPYVPDAPPKPLGQYGSLKREAEDLVAATRDGCVIRSALMYGPPGTHSGSFLAWMVRTLAAGKDLELFGDEVRTPVFVEDVCRAIAALLGTRSTGIWHAGGPERLTRFQMGKELCAVFNLDENRLVPRRLAESNYAAPRPRDVSLVSDATWELAGVQPRRFADALAQIRAQCIPFFKLQ